MKRITNEEQWARGKIFDRLYKRNENTEDFKQANIMGILDNVNIDFKNLESNDSAYKNGRIILPKSLLYQDDIDMNDIEYRLMYQYIRFVQDINILNKFAGNLSLNDLVKGDHFANFVFLVLSEVDADMKADYFLTGNKNFTRGADKTETFCSLVESKFRRIYNRYNVSYNNKDDKDSGKRVLNINNNTISISDAMMKSLARIIVSTFTSNTTGGKIFDYKLKVGSIISTIDAIDTINKKVDEVSKNVFGDGKFDAFCFKNEEDFVKFIRNVKNDFYQK